VPGRPRPGETDRAADADLPVARRRDLATIAQLDVTPEHPDIGPWGNRAV